MANAGAIPTAADLSVKEASKDILRKAGRGIINSAKGDPSTFWFRHAPYEVGAPLDKVKYAFGFSDVARMPAGTQMAATKLGGAAAGIKSAINPANPASLAIAGMQGAYDGFNTSTDEYRARMGLDPSASDPSVWDGVKDAAVRSAGVLSDVGNHATWGMADKFGKWSGGKIYDAVHYFDRDLSVPSDTVMTYRMYPMSARPADWYTQSHPEAAAAPTTSSSRPAPTTSPAAAPADSSVADAESRRFAAGRMNNDAASQRIDQYGLGNTPDINKVAGQYGVDPSKVSLRNINGTNVYKVGKNTFTDGSDPRGALPAGLAHFGVTAVDPATGKPLPPQQEAGGQTGSATAAAAPTSGAVASIGSGSDEVASYRNALQSELMKAMKDPKATVSYVNQLTDALTAMDTNQINREQNAVQMAQARASMNRQGLRDMLDGRQFMLDQDKFEYQQQKDAAEMAKSIGKDQVDQANANRNANMESAKQFDAHFMEQGKDGKWVVNEAKKADFTGRVSKSFGKSFDQMSEPERINALNMYQLRQRWLEDKGASWMGMTVNGVLGRSSGKDSENLNDFDPKKITTDGTWAYFNDDPNRRVELKSILNVDGPTTWYTPDNQTQAQFGVVPANLRRVTH